MVFNLFIIIYIKILYIVFKKEKNYFLYSKKKYFFYTSSFALASSRTPSGSFNSTTGIIPSVVPDISSG